MGFLSGMDIVASGLTAQRLRMDLISDNIANIDTTKTEDGTVYTRKYVVLQEQQNNFSNVLENASSQVTGGVKVSEIGADSSNPELVYDPKNANANADGYVEYPNVDVTQEMVDMISAYRSYEANVTAFGAYKDMALKSLEIGS